MRFSLMEKLKTTYRKILCWKICWVKLFFQEHFYPEKIICVFQLQNFLREFIFVASAENYRNQKRSLYIINRKDSAVHCLSVVLLSRKQFFRRIYKILLFLSQSLCRMHPARARIFLPSSARPS